MELKRIRFKKNRIYIPKNKICYSLLKNKKLLKELQNIRSFCKEYTEYEGEELIKRYFDGEIIIRYNFHKGKHCAQFHPETRQISINKKYKNKVMGDTSVCHEIGHYIQMKLCLFTFMESRLSKIIQMEQQAETLSYYLYKMFYRSDVPKSLFTSYFKEKHIISTYYDYKNGNVKIINDLFEFLNPNGKEEEKYIRGKS